MLFIIVAELLAIHVKNNLNIQPLNVKGNSLVISQLADDTTLFLKNARQIPVALKEISLFSKASGLKLNMEKCEIVTIQDHDMINMYNIPVKNEVRYLGIIISKDKKVRETSNIQNIIQKNRTILNSWLQRDLTVFGRILLTKMQSLSRLTYPAYSLDIPDKLIKKINEDNFNFIWKNKYNYINKSDTVKPAKEGELNAIDFDPMNGTIKLKWLQNFIIKCDNFWFDFPFKIFKMFGGIHFLLRCDFNISKLPINLSNFHQHVLQYWKLIYKHNFTPHMVPIWNNRCILIKRKSFFYGEWMEKGVWSIVHLLDNYGNFLTYDVFIKKYNLIYNLAI